VTLEDALILLLAAAAGVLLFLGLAQALDDRPPPAPTRRRRAVPAQRAAPGRPRPEPVPAPAGPQAVIEAQPAAAGRDAAASAAAVAAPEPAAADLEPELPPGPPGAPEMALLEACVTLYQQAKYRELLAATGPYLRTTEDPQQEQRVSHALTALWSLAAVAHEAQGRHSDARACFQAALRTAPAGPWEACPPRIAGLAVPIARRLLETAERAAEGAPERIAAPRLARVWLGWRLSAMPEDRGPAALLEHASEMGSEGYWEVAAAMIRRQDFGDARRLIEEGRRSGALEPERADALLSLLSGSLAEEIARLTAPAIRGSAPENQAVVALETAQAMLGPVEESGLPREQYLAMARRVWRGYAKLGLRRLRAGNLEAALETLFHALGMKQIDGRRQRLVRDALVRALEGLTEQAGETVGRLLRAGRWQGAHEEVQHLALQLGRAREEGVSREELSLASTRVRQLMERLEQEKER
jgi:tetratricopeptide (TPR) repeat protein